MSRSWWARAALLVFLLIVSCVILMPTVVEMALYPESKDEVVGQDEENAVRNPPLPEWYTSLPSWLKSKTLSLGLDLQGGLMLRYSVDIDSAIDDKLASNAANIRSALAKLAGLIQKRYNQIHFDDKAYWMAQQIAAIRYFNDKGEIVPLSITALENFLNRIKDNIRIQ